MVFCGCQRWDCGLLGVVVERVESECALAHACGVQELFGFSLYLSVARKGQRQREKRWGSGGLPAPGAVVNAVFSWPLGVFLPAYALYSVVTLFALFEGRASGAVKVQLCME